MAKKPAPAKSKNKPQKPAKPASKAAGSAKPTLKDRVKAGLQALVKPSRVGGDKPAASKPTPAKMTAKSAGKGAAGAKGKKAKKNVEEEDFLSEPIDSASDEELPDLTDFDVEEVPEEVEDDTDDIDSDDEIEELEAAPAPSDEIILTDAEGRRYCKVKECDQISSVDTYCRFHYLLLWKRIQVRRKILVDGKLEKYVDDLTSRYPDKFLEMIRRDLKTEKDFMAAIAELEIDESALDNEFEDEAQSFIDEVRGVTSEAGMSDEEEF